MAQVQKSVDKIVTAALNLHQKVATTFLPTAIKFHYIFNLRDLSNIFQVRGRCTWVFVCTCFFFFWFCFFTLLVLIQTRSMYYIPIAIHHLLYLQYDTWCVCLCLQGILFSTPECVKAPMDFVRLWLHEASRVYGDKLIEEKDMELFSKMKFNIAKDSFEVMHEHCL